VCGANKGCNGEEEKDGDAAAALTHAVALVGAPSVYSCGGAEKRRGCDGNVAATFAHAVGPVGAPSAAAAELYGEWRGGGKSCCCAEQRRFRKNQVARCDSAARRATFDNWRLAVEHRFTPIARAEFQDRGSEHEHALEFHPNKPPDYPEEAE
jgi:hypothetical protein